LSTKIFDIYRLTSFLPSKNISHDFISIKTHDWVNTFALTEEGKVIMVRQHRLGKNIVTLEVPAGAINKDEQPDLAAIRELEEETGFTPEKLILMKSINVNPAIQDNRCHFFLALGCKKTKSQVLDATEELEVVIKDKSEIFDAIFKTDIIENSVALMSVMFAKEYLSENKI
jgi:8-oxo-dGTP pyrophosphatase MutT (NUDIX family)